MASPFLRRGTGFTETGGSISSSSSHDSTLKPAQNPHHRGKPQKQPYLHNLQIHGKNHGLPLARRSCHFLFLSRGALQGGHSVTCTDVTFVKHSVKPLLHKLLNSDTSHCGKGTQTRHSLHLHSQILSMITEVNTIHLCKLEEVHRCCLSAPKSSRRGAMNKQLGQRKAVLLPIKSMAKLPTRSSAASAAKSSG